MDVADRHPRILITRLSALGDCILTLPLACALRRRYPQALLVWAAEPLAARILKYHGTIDELITIPKHWLKSPRTIAHLRAHLRAFHFHYAIDPQSLTKSAALGWFGNATRRIGFSRPRGRELAPVLNNELIAGDRLHIVDATLQLLAPLDITEPVVEFDFPILQQAEQAMLEFVREAHLTGGFVTINPGTTWPSKCWLPNRYGQVARYVGEQFGLPSAVVWYGDQELQWAKEIVAHSGGHALLAPPTDVMQLAALFRHARFVIAPDTGPLHLAAAVGTPCIGLYGPTRAERCGPYGTRHVVLQVEWPIPRNRRRRRQDRTAMRAISTEVVCQACHTLLQRLESEFDAPEVQSVASPDSHAA